VPHFGSLLFSGASTSKRFEPREVLGRRREPMSLLRKIKGDGATTNMSPLTGLPGRCRTWKTLEACKIGWPDLFFLGKLRLPALPAFNAGRRGFLSRSGCGHQTAGRGQLARRNSMTCLVPVWLTSNLWRGGRQLSAKVAATLARAQLWIPSGQSSKTEIQSPMPSKIAKNLHLELHCLGSSQAVKPSG